MADSVEYELNLKDNFSGPLDQAKGHAEGFHESVMHIVEALGLIEAAHQVFDFLKESLSEFEAHQVALASLTQMYKNNSETIGVSLDKMKELAEAQQKLTGIHTEDTMAAEQNLLKFREIRIGYEELIPVIGDFARATKTDAAEAANTLGRALENPQRAMRLLMQAGVSPEQIQSIQNLQKMGHVAQAQQEIFEILKQKYHGVAKAMYDANPAEQMAIQMKDLKEQFGQIEEGLLRQLMPAITSVFEYIHQAVEYLKEHKEALKEVLTIVGLLATSFVTYRIVLWSVANEEKILAAAMAVKNTVMELSAAYSMALAEGYGVLEAAQWALNVAMDANPIGLLIIGLTTLSAAAYEVYKHWDQLKKMFGDGWENFKKMGSLLWEYIISPLQETYYTLKSVWDSIKGDSKAAAEDLQRAHEAALKPAKDKAEYILWLQKTKAEEEAGVKGIIKGEKGEEGKIAKGAKLPDSIMPTKSDKVAGSSQVTINVVIQKMIGIEKFIGGTKEAVVKAAENMEMLLSGSVNQFQANIDT